MTIQERAQQAKKSSILLAAADTDLKNKGLHAIADALRKKIDTILAANADRKSTRLNSSHSSPSRMPSSA